MLSISQTNEWRKAHPAGIIGILELSKVRNDLPSPSLEERKRDLEASLRERYRGFSRKDFLSLPVMADYERYYRQFNKTYHVLLQVESIVLKGKNLPSVSPLVDSNFMAEMETLVLTAGHDIAGLQEPVFMDVSREGDQLIQMGGTARIIRAGDMVMRDAHGISCSILYGQDDRSPITPDTSQVLFVVYAPAGVHSDAVGMQLHMLEKYIRLFSPDAIVENHQLLSG
jgi:DNA/RNA-binding domain of Phe-tRNA-synthetase-like protein